MEADLLAQILEELREINDAAKGLANVDPHRLGDQ